MTSTLLITSLDERWQKYSVELANCRAAFSEAAVHDVRVATRRLLATLDLIAASVSDVKTTKLHRALKEQLDDIDDLRDTQVMLAEATEQLSSIPALVTLQIYLQKREQRFMRKAQEDIEALDIDKLEKRLLKIRTSLLANAETNIDLLSVVDDAFLAVIKRTGKVDPAEPATIHRVRIAFKTFRYMVEIIHPVLPDFPKKQLKQMQDYQTSMGDIQDVEVFLRTLEKFSSRDDSYDPEPVRRFYQDRHTELISAYLGGADNLAAFWRATPEAPFPWEKTHESLRDTPRHRRRIREGRNGRQPTSINDEGKREDAPDSSRIEIPQRDL
jgi:CHAD domain-containing protein